jgi:prepilin-type N-terminal cleavage/methylation domain-containing protein
MTANRTGAACRRGFTLTELMTVVTILSTSLALLLPTIVRIVQWNRKQTDTALVVQHLDRLREVIERDIERVEKVDPLPDGDVSLYGKGFEVLYRQWAHGIAREDCHQACACDGIQP